MVILHRLQGNLNSFPWGYKVKLLPLSWHLMGNFGLITYLIQIKEK